jgi:cyclase
MAKFRIIARMDIKDDCLVKGIHLEGLRVLGKPQDFSSLYYHENVDELYYMDTVASLFERNHLSSTINKTAKNNFLPLTCAGGVRTLEDIEKMLQAGADRVSINTAATKNPMLIKEASEHFGSSTICVAIESSYINGKNTVCIENGREITNLETVTWAKQVEKLGAGEIILTSIDHEGRAEGFNLHLINQVALAVNIPVIAHGGAGKVEHVIELATQTNVSGVCIGSAFHYHYLKNIANLVDISEITSGNTSFLESGQTFEKVQGFSVNELRSALLQNNIYCRRSNL